MTSITSAKFTDEMNSLFDEYLKLIQNNPSIDFDIDKLKQIWQFEMQTKIENALNNKVEHICVDAPVHDQDDKVDIIHFVTGTPINLIRPSGDGIKAKLDYLRERYESNGFREACKWDDTWKNNSEVGQLFAFIHQVENKIQIFKITHIETYEKRRDEWDIIEHRKRNVLHMSPMIKEFPLTEFAHNYLPTWKKNGTLATVYGTTRYKTTYRKN